MHFTYTQSQFLPYNSTFASSINQDGQTLERALSFYTLTGMNGFRLPLDNYLNNSSSLKNAVNLTTSTINNRSEAYFIRMWIRMRDSNVTS